MVSWASPCLSFFLSASTAVTYIFTAPNCTTTIISFELCALNVEFQHFMLRFYKMSLLETQFNEDESASLCYRAPYMVQEGYLLCWGWHITICKVLPSLVSRCFLFEILHTTVCWVVIKF
jgi:hypothetical protein